MTALLTIITLGLLAAATGLIADVIADIIKDWRTNPPKFNWRKHWRDSLMMGGITVAALGVIIGLTLEAINK